jgi:ABC-type multidrug transport system ATPase subunit
LVELTDALQGVHLTVNCFPGLACVRLSKAVGVSPDRLRHAIFHEVAHAFLSCGNRLLDEGWAHYFAHAFAAGAHAGGDPQCTFSLRALLSRAAGRTLLFEDAGAEVADIRAISALGARVVGSVIAQQGVDGVLSLFRQVLQSTSDAEVYQLVETAIGAQLETFHQVLPSGAELAKLAEEARDAEFRAYATQQPSDLDAAIAKLSSSAPGRSAVILDALLSVLLAKSILSLNVNQPVHAEQLAIIDMYFQDGAMLPESRLWTLRGHRAVLALKLEKANFIKAATYSKKAVAAYEKALALNPNDPDTVIGRALLLINTPPQYGGSVTAGLDMIRSLSQQVERYAAHAKQILLRLCGADAQPLDAPVPPSSQVTPPTVIIAVQGLRHDLSETFTLDIQALKILDGQRVAIVGRNGCGKTTLLETVAGLRSATHGEVVLLGSRIGAEHNRALNRHLGMSMQQAGLFSTMYVREIVRIHFAAYQCQSDEVFQTLGMQELMPLQFKALSRGQIQRVQLYLALAHVPRLMLLDEPSLGLDEWFASALREWLRKASATIVMISHDAADIAVADRVLLMDCGRVVDDGPLSELKDKYSKQYKLKVLQALTPDLERALAQLADITVAGARDGTPWAALATDSSADVFRQIVNSQQVRAFSIEPTTTDDFLAEITRQTTT